MKKLNFENMENINGGYRGKATLNRYGTNVNPFEPETFEMDLTGKGDVDRDALECLLENEYEKGNHAELILNINGEKTMINAEDQATSWFSPVRTAIMRGQASDFKKAKR